MPSVCSASSMTSMAAPPHAVATFSATARAAIVVLPPGLGLPTTTLIRTKPPLCEPDCARPAFRNRPAGTRRLASPPPTRR